MSAAPSVVYVLPDKMGGMVNIVANLLEYRRPDEFEHRVVLTHNRASVDARHEQPLRADAQTNVEYRLPIENLHAVLRRLAAAVGVGPGVVVAGDLLDLAMLSVHDLGRAVVFMLHGDHEYYYDLAVKHDAVVHAYVTYSRRMHDSLIQRLPHRAADILYLPYGIPLPARVRQPGAGPLRLIFAGRIDQPQKGVLDLPEIDAALRDARVDVAWTIVGAGPDEARLREAWRVRGGLERVRFVGRLSNGETIDRLADHDVFVLPTRSEGFPVALLEALGAGVVPVVSDIESGVPEVVTDGCEGFRRPVGDVGGFASAIGALAADRSALERMSAAARRRVEQQFDVRARVGDYQALYARYRDIYRPLRADATLQYGSRLDRDWIPNAAVYAIRRGHRWLRGKS